MADERGKPIGFLKFVIVITIVSSVVRMLLSGVDSLRGTSMILFAVGGWLFYRYARVQPWWPFRLSTTVESASPPKRNVVGKVAIKRTSKTVGRKITEKYAPKAQPRSHATEVQPIHVSRVVDPQVSNIPPRTRAVRTKIAIRTKTNRSKSVRLKRAPAVPFE